MTGILGTYEETLEIPFNHAIVVPRIWHFYPSGSAQAKKAKAPFALGAWSYTAQMWGIDEDLTAICSGYSGANKKGDHKPPQKNCSCGYYAWKLLPDNYIQSIVQGVESLTAQIEAGGEPTAAFLCMGQAFFWGTCLHYSQGWRVEMARFRSLFAAPTNPEMIERMEQITNVKLDIKQILTYNDFMYRVAGGLVPIEELQFFENINVPRG